MDPATIRRILWRAWEGDDAAQIAAHVQAPFRDVVDVLTAARDRLTIAVPIQEPGAVPFERHHRWNPKHDAPAMLRRAIVLKREDPRRTTQQIADLMGVPFGTLRSYMPKWGVSLTDPDGSEQRLRTMASTRTAVKRSDNRQRQVANAAVAIKRAEPGATRRQIAARLGIGKGMLDVYLWREGVRLGELGGRGLRTSPRADKSESVRARPAETADDRQTARTTPKAGGETLPTVSRPAPLRGGAAVAARRVHDPEVARSTRAPATKLTADEKAAVEVAVAEGKVKRIEQGEFPDTGRPLSRFDPRWRKHAS